MAAKPYRVRYSYSTDQPVADAAIHSRHEPVSALQRAGIFKRKRWQATRRAILARDPLCKVCDQRPSEEIDHITPLSQGGDPWALEGLQGICGPCHCAKTARENAA